MSISIWKKNYFSFFKAFITMQSFPFLQKRQLIRLLHFLEKKIKHTRLITWKLFCDDHLQCHVTIVHSVWITSKLRTFISLSHSNFIKHDFFSSFEENYLYGIGLLTLALTFVTMHLIVLFVLEYKCQGLHVKIFSVAFWVTYNPAKLI